MPLVKGTCSNCNSILYKYRKWQHLGNGIFHPSTIGETSSFIPSTAQSSRNPCQAHQDVLYISLFLKKKKVVFRSTKGLWFMEGLASMNSKQKWGHERGLQDCTLYAKKYCHSKMDGKFGLSVELLKYCFRSFLSYSKQRISWTFLTHSKSLLRLVKEKQLLQQANQT